jgi:hypothetical protein
VKKARQALKTQIEIPHMCSPTLRGNMFDFQSQKLLKDVQSAAASSMIFDLRTAQQMIDAKYENPTTTLN